MIAVVAGFMISIVLAVWAYRRTTAMPGSSRSAGLLYTIPSLAAFALLRPITGLTLLTAVIPLTTYTLLILVRSNVAGFDSVPADVLEAAEGMGYTRRERLLRVELPLALPLIMSGIRLATVTTIGLATVASILGETFGGFGFFITEGLNRFFLTEIYAGAVLSIGLAFGADFLLVRLERRLTPWARARAETALMGDVIAWFLDPAHLSGPGSIPQRLLEHILLCAAAAADSDRDRLADRPLHRPYPALRRDRDQRRQHRPGAALVCARRDDPAGLADAEPGVRPRSHPRPSSR